MTDTLKLEGVGLDVRDGSSLRTLLEIDEFCLEPGEMIAVRGASGAGKTTVLDVIRELFDEVDFGGAPDEFYGEY